MSYKSIPHLFFEACERYQKTEAVLVKTDGHYSPYSHRFFAQRVKTFGRGLMAMGLKPKQHFAILSETRFDWAVADLGILSAGGVSVPIYDTLTPKEIRYILHDSESVGVIVSNMDQFEKVQSIKADLPQLIHVIVMDPAESLGDAKSMKAVEILGSDTDNEAALEARIEAIDRQQLMTLIYTSGTTGDPKGVMLSHHNLLSNIEGVIDAVPYTEADIHLAHLPLSHVLERMSGFYLMICAGVTIAYAESMATIRDNLLEVRPTVMVSVPRLFEKIYAGIHDAVKSGSFIKRTMFKWATSVARDAVPYFVAGKPLPGLLATKYKMADKAVFAKVRDRTGGRLRYLISGGAPLSKEIGEFFLGIGIKILEGYGLTETSPVLCVNRPDKNKPGTVGPAIPNVEIKFADDGEILAKGPNVMMGYYNNPKATAESIVDGWFHTGDIGVMDDDGFVRITDRKKEIIVTSGGKNIAPQPIENALKLSPLIENAILIGDRRNYVTALIVPPWETVAQWAPQHQWPTDPLTLCAHAGFRKAITDEIAFRLKDFARYEKVKKFEILPDPLSVINGELTPSLKIRRKIINQRYAQTIEQLYAESE
ncbi:MAG: long-chain fatty acid--CoA ligase [Acidobacteria bacterium]|nr:long-chain fatty acid--CoA ligase [Acidobacteriota bacterium]